MNRTMKRTVSVILAAILILGSFSAGSATFAADTGYQNGDVIAFGSYPQSRETDEETLVALNDLRITWQSYGYYGYAYPFQNVETGMTQIPYDYMKYADVQLNGVRYRAVRFSEYRPRTTGSPWGSIWTEQIKNGYSKDTTYWFRYEPLRWRILDADEQLLISETIIDAQPYSNTCFYSEDGKTYKDYTCTVDYRNYEDSSIRAFLNDPSQTNGFADLAFTEDEWSAILTTHLDNRDDAQLRDKTGEDTDDKVFLPSADLMNDTWYWAGQHATDQEQWAARKAVGTDYAHCQGLHGNPVTKEAGYLLRTMNANTQSGGGIEYCVNPSGGPATASTSALSIYYGIRPAMRIDLSALPADSHTLYGGKCGEKLVWRFDDGEMRVEGSGAMTKYENASACPWHPLRDQIRFVTVKDIADGSVSSISAYAFQDCANLTEVFLSGVQEIGTHAFYGCDQLCYVTTFAEQLTAQNAFSADNPILRIYCQSARVQRAVQSMGCTGLILAEEDHVLSVPGTLQINSSTPLIHLPQWVSFFTDAQWIHFDQMVFDGVLPSVLAARNASFSDAGAASLTLSDFYCSWYTLNSQALNITSAAVLAGLQDETCAAFFGDPEFGRHIEFGSYPQTEVKNADLTDALNALTTEWISYGYYSGDGTIGSMQPGDYMQYTDVEYEGVRYRGVRILAVRPSRTYERATSSSARRFYGTGTYWFRWEPLLWRILDADEGFVFSENVLDFQPFHNIYYADSESAYTEQGLSFPGNYAESSIRTWLNETFFNTAFTAQEQDEIVLSHNITDAQGSNHYSNNSDDMVFLPSIEELTAEQYGFLSSENYDPARGSMETKSRWTDYSKSQGMDTVYDFHYAVRTATDVAEHTIVSEYGNITQYSTYYLRGIRPSMRIDPALLTEEPDDPPVGPQKPTTGTCGENVQWAFDEESGVLSLGGTGAMDSLGAFEDYGYSVWKDDIQFVAAADGVTAIGAHAFEGCPILEEVILGEDVTQIGEAAFKDCPRLMNVTLLSGEISANGAFPDDCMDWMLVFPEDNLQAVALAKHYGISWIPVSYKDSVLSFGGTITVRDGYAYSYLPMFVQRYGSAQKVYFNRLVFADIPADSVKQQSYTGEFFGSLTMHYVEVTLLYIREDGTQEEVTYDRMIELLQSGDYRAFKLRVSSTTQDGEEQTQEEIIEQKLSEIFPFMPKRVLRLVSKAINFIVSIFKKK